MINLKNKLESMPLEDLIAGINDFTATTRERELTKEEADHRQAYRMEYIDRIKRNMRSTLDNTTFEIVDEGNNGSNS
jgi:uncharacterized protein YnzC (UPF0291/DUF896 family)